MAWFFYLTYEIILSKIINSADPARGLPGPASSPATIAGQLPNRADRCKLLISKFEKAIFTNDQYNTSGREHKAF
jgi:hypothetical protein